MSEKKTHWKKLDNPDYLGAYSLLDGNNKDLVVLIEGVQLSEVESDRGKQSVKVVRLKGQKPMILNATNSKSIEKALGTPYIEEWSGQYITLYVARIKAFGDMVDCIRVRPTKPVAKKLPALTPEHEKWIPAMEALKKKAITMKSLLTNYSITKENQELLCK